MAAATAYAECPECGQTVPIGIDMRIETDDEGTQILVTEPDLADLWAHAWIHNPRAAAPQDGAR